MEHSKNVFQDKKLSLKAKGLIYIILSNNLADDFTITGFCKNYMEGKAQVQSAIKELIKHGYCVRRKEKDWQGRYAGYKYYFFTDKIQS